MDYAVQLMISRQYFSTKLSEAMFMIMDARMICLKVRFSATANTGMLRSWDEVLLDMIFVEKFRGRQFRTVR
jgi:hypothetical protein